MDMNTIKAAKIANKIQTQRLFLRKVLSTGFSSFSSESFDPVSLILGKKLISITGR
jgi:hypothetical protein